MPSDPVAFAHEHLVLERWAFSGRPVDIKDGRWRSKGYSAVDAEGRPAKPNFGAVAPQLPGLAARLRDWPAVVVESAQEDALSVAPEDFPREARFVLDPPYPGTADYGYDVSSWDAFVAYALRCGEWAPTVVTVRDPIPALRDAGWAEVVPSRKGKKGTMGARAGDEGKGDSELLYVGPRCRQ